MNLSFLSYRSTYFLRILIKILKIPVGFGNFDISFKDRPVFSKDFSSIRSSWNNPQRKSNSSLVSPSISMMPATWNIPHFEVSKPVVSTSMKIFLSLIINHQPTRFIQLIPSLPLLFLRCSIQHGQLSHSQSYLCSQP